MSRIGKLPIHVPNGVSITVKDNIVKVKGPKGELQQNVNPVISVEMNNGQMIDDIRLAIECARPVSLVNRMGGNLPTVDLVVSHCRKLAEGGK